MTFKPFANETDALTVGELNIENRVDRVSIFGSVDVTRDKRGLKMALALKALAEALVVELSSATLPDTVASKPVGRTDNPFSGT